MRLVCNLKVVRWKTGFLRIAKLTQAKILLISINSPTKTILIGNIFEPTGDTELDLNFIQDYYQSFKGQPTGSKADYSVVENCMRWAKKGYVAVAMDYRLGWNPTSTDQNVRTSTLLQAAYRGIQDAKAMVRYMRKTEAEDGNPYGVHMII